MSLFEMPAGIAVKLNKLYAQFIWGPNASRPIHWVKWVDVAKPREVGGLGLVDFRTKNRALLNKWVWQYSHEPESLWRLLVDAKYDQQSNTLLPGPIDARKQSWVWKNITKPLLDTDDVFNNNIVCKLGDGSLIKSWDPSLKLAFLRVFSLAIKKEGKVCEFGSIVHGR
ncbi:hypothetical protein like AT4G29090 [Hibiscus trionum]|uniref:Uncharacterized protein n=1 Tax=Hibiscus trionum TaxID=183268 RepID=A0A9W7I5U9_HIBTR|nr:hypothetical protein like AT4G29090 [Hibiscus trionum]